MRAMDADGPGEEPRVKKRWIPRNVKITLLVLLLFFVVEVVLPPELHSARKEFRQLDHLNFLWLILGTVLELASLAAYAELTHTVLSPGAPKRFRLFRINMWALAVSHVLPGGTVPGTAVSYRLLTEAEVPGNTAAFGTGHPGHRLGRRPQRAVLAGPPHLHPAQWLQPLLRLRRHPRCSAPVHLRRPGRCCSPGARSRRTVSCCGWRPTFPSSSPKAWRRWSRRWPTA